MSDYVVLIDDDPVTNFLHRRLIESQFEDATVKVFENGLEALKYIKSHQEHSFRIFLDINMPVMNGWEFLEALDEHGIELRGDIIILTSSIEQADRQRASQYGIVQDFISKPLTRSHLSHMHG